MMEIISGGERQTVSHSHPAAGLLKTYVFAVALGVAIIGALTSYTIRREYEATLTLWRSRLSIAVVNKVWVLRVSLAQSQDDTRFLADFALTRKLLSVRTKTRYASHALVCQHRSWQFSTITKRSTDTPPSACSTMKGKWCSRPRTRRRGAL